MQSAAPAALHTYSTCVTYNFICLVTKLVLITVKVQKVLAKMNGDWIPILLMSTMFVNCVYLRCDLSICLDAYGSIVQIR